MEDQHQPTDLRSRSHGNPEALSQGRNVGLLWLIVFLSALVCNSMRRVHTMIEFPQERTEHTDIISPLPIDVISPLSDPPQAKPKRFGFVHLGKCGGVSVIRTLLGYPGLLTPVGRAFSGSKHYHLARPEVDEYDNWILAVRDPVGRIRSWWTYDHSDNLLYRNDYRGHLDSSTLLAKLFECYPTLDSFTTNGLAPNTTLPDECQTLAQMSIPLRGSSFSVGLPHLRFNFDRYFPPLLAAEGKALYVVRTERMLNDMNSISFELGDDGSRLTGVVHQSHWRSEDYPNKDRYISEKGMGNLCRHLCNEIQIYKQILARGINIGNEERESSLLQLSKSCPLQVKSAECPLGMSETEWETMVDNFRIIGDQEMRQVHIARKALLEKRRNPPPPMNKSQKVELHYQIDQNETSYGFLHLGRCGGQTVRSLLESHKETKLYQKHVNGTWTSQQSPLCWKHTHWVILTRDPLERLASWWAYHHPSNLAMRSDRHEEEKKPHHLRAGFNKFYECYPTFKDFVDKGFGASAVATEEAKECRMLARRTFSNFGRTLIPLPHDVHHAYQPYEYDFKLYSSEYIFFVVRAEYMSIDMNGIEAILTRKPSDIFLKEEVDDLKHLSSTESWPVTSSIGRLDATALGNLCRHMCSHIQMYKFFLREAINLERSSYKLSMKQLKKTCPVEAKRDDC